MGDLSLPPPKYEATTINPSPGNQNPAAGANLNVAGACRNPSDERDKKPSNPGCMYKSAAPTFGFDTPLGKVPRQVIRDDLRPIDRNNSSVFSNIMHKFVKVDSEAKSNPGCMYKSAAPTFGIDTPLRKVPRQVIRDDLRPIDRNNSSAFSNIMHKFVKVDSENLLRGSDDFSAFSMFDRFNECEEKPEEFKTADKVPENHIVPKSNTKLSQLKAVVKSPVNLCKPETVVELPPVPRIKRILEEGSKYDDSHRRDLSLTNPSKRVKFLQDSKPESKLPASKFEWLDPSQIRDANGRRPGDPLYENRTLYIPPDTMKKMSALQKQYWSVKCQYMDVLLFFNVGKYYALYELDAEIGHKELDWKITNSAVGKCRQVGIYESGIDDAVQKLVARGYKVGRIEQLETSEQVKAREGAHAVIPRKLVNVITPSTSTDDIGPDAAVYLLAIKEGFCEVDSGAIVYGFAFVDCVALKFWVGSVTDDASHAALMALLMQVSPKEIIYENRGLSREAQKVLQKYSSTGSVEVQCTPVLPVNGFTDAVEVKITIQSKKYFKGSDNLLDCLLDGVPQHQVTLCALGGLVDYMSRLMLDHGLCNGEVLPYEVYKGCLRMDGQTLVNLEVFHNSADGGPDGTLFKYLDKCVTLVGKRLLRNWICHPLKEYLCKVPDLERLLGRVKASVHSQATLLLPLMGKKALKQRVKAFVLLVKGLRVAIDLLILLQDEEYIAPLLSKILDFPELSRDRGLNLFLRQCEAAIGSDVPNYQGHQATESNPETLAIVIELFVEDASKWSQVIFAISCIDVFRSFATIGKDSSGSMCRPFILPQATANNLCQNGGGPVLKIKGLWHPFALGEGGVPVPNDLAMGEDTDCQNPRTLLLTGPNMGGKSTLLRAACLSVIMAQLGSYVAGETCVLSAADMIFTRIGATDRIMTGESTFYIECAETAPILKNATLDSLVLLDELGRGTSTFDGYAIAYAVFRHLIEKVNCRLLFATHFHPLTKEFASHPHVSLQHMACAFRLKSPLKHKDDYELVFLYQLAFGACPESYGLQVALMAGIPKK